MWGGNSGLYLIWCILCVLLILVLAYVFTKFVGSRKRPRAFGAAKGTQRFRVAAQLPLGKEQLLLLVQAGDRYYLLGVTASQITRLAEIPPEEAEAWIQPENPPPDTPSFMESLRTVIQRRGQR